MEKTITLANCSDICNLASDVEGDVTFCREYNSFSGERTGGDSLAFVLDFDDSCSVFRLALAIQTVLGAEVTMSMVKDMGVQNPGAKKFVYFAGWSAIEGMQDISVGVYPTCIIYTYKKNQLGTKEIARLFPSKDGVVDLKFYGEWPTNIREWVAKHAKENKNQLPRY